VEHYFACFNGRYKIPPLEPNNIEREALKYVLRRVKDFDLVKAMLTTYLSLTGQRRDDNWFVEQGHDLITFKNKLNFLYSYTAQSSSDGPPTYIVGFTSEGFPVASKEAIAAINGFMPTEFTKWLNLSEDHKFVLPEGRWKTKGVDTSQFKKTWDYFGFNPLQRRKPR
jgi:hypothetical protein